MKALFLVLLAGFVLFASGAQAANGSGTATTPQTGGASTGTAAAAQPEIDENDLALDPGAASANTANTQNSTPAVFGAWDLIQMVLVLLLVVGAIYGVFAFIRRARKKDNLDETKLINLMASQGLPGNRWVHLIGVQEQVFLIGSSESSVNLIAEITEPEARDQLRLMASDEKPVSKSGFQAMLGNIFGNQNKQNPQTGFDLIRKQRDRLKKL